MSNEKKRLQGGLLIWLVASALVAAGHISGVLQQIEHATWDWRIRAIADPRGHDPKIKVITIDQASLEYVSREMGLSWPWPRSVYAPILEFLAKAGAKAVAFDLLFTEHSNEANDDETFAQSVESTLPVVSAVALQRGTMGESPETLKLFTDRQETRRSVIQAYLEGAARPVFPAAALPIEELIRASAGLGSVTSAADEDQIIRHAQPGGYLKDVPILSLPFALYAAVQGDDAAGQDLRKCENELGEFLLRYHGPAQTYDTFSLSAVLSSWVRMSEGQEAKVSLREFKDAYVFIGGSAPGLLDLRAVPFDGAYPGVEVNATILDNLIHRSFLRHVPLLLSLGVAAITLLVACVAGLFLHRGGLLAQVGLIAAWVAGCFWMAHLGWWLPMVDVLCGMFFVGVATGVLQYQIEGRQHRFIRNAFKYYISPEVIEQIIEDPSLLRLGGERRELSIFFSDIQGFTGISERLSPDQLVQFLNRFLSEMSTIILQTGGTLDKYQGDAVIAFWNAPLTVVDHRERAVTAALRCQERLRELAPEFERAFGIKVRMRIGIHTGTVSVGNFGSDQRFNYTMIGDAANVASRLEGVNKVFGTTIITSESTMSEAPDGVVWRKLGRVKVVGRNEPITIYQPIDPNTDVDLVRRLSTYHDGLARFEAGDMANASKAFESLADDSVSQSYCARIERELSAGTFDSPVWDVKEK